MIKYIAKIYPSEIEKTEVVGETDKFVTVETYGSRTRRQAKVSEFECFFDTWADAHKHLLNLAEKKLKARKIRLNEAEEEYRRLYLLEQD